jgi:hypothetical protein
VLASRRYLHRWVASLISSITCVVCARSPSPPLLSSPFPSFHPLPPLLSALFHLSHFLTSRFTILTPPPFLSQVPDSVKEGIEIVYVENVGEVIRQAFVGQPIADKVEALRDTLLPRGESQA